MNAFELVLIVIGVIALAIATRAHFRSGGAARHLGRSPESFAHPEDEPVSEWASEDGRDAPLPKRPMRGRG
jgi:hypothetical protein